MEDQELEVQEEEQKEENEISEEQLAEEAAFFNEEGLEFEEVITKDDVFALNVYLVRNAPSNLVGRIMFMIMGVIVSILPIFNPSNWWAIIIGVPMFAYGLIIYMPLQILMIKRSLAKKNFEPLDISLRITNTKILYKLKKEEHAPLVKINDIVRVVKTPSYIYMHLNTYSVILIKLEELENVEAVIEKMKELFVPLKKYHEKKK